MPLFFCHTLFRPAYRWVYKMCCHFKIITLHLNPKELSRHQCGHPHHEVFRPGAVQRIYSPIEYTLRFTRITSQDFSRKGEKVFVCGVLRQNQAQKLHRRSKPTIIFAPEIFDLTVQDENRLPRQTGFCPVLFSKLCESMQFSGRTLASQARYRGSENPITRIQGYSPNVRIYPT